MKKAYLIVVMVLFLAAAWVQAGQGPGGKCQKPGQGGKAGCMVGFVLKSQEALSLDPNQIQELKALRDANKDQLKAIAEAVKAKRDALQELIKAGRSEADIRTVAAALGSALGDQAILKAAIGAKVNVILTDEQKAKLAELKEQKAEGPKGQCGKGKQGPGKCPETAFKAIDTDGNGVISLEEFKVHMEQMKERCGRGGPRGPHGCNAPPPPTGDEEKPTDEP